LLEKMKASAKCLNARPDPISPPISSTGRRSIIATI
jgi:hypothetical protein